MLVQKPTCPPQSSSFDSQYALRLCTQANKLEACVQIYTQMQLYEDAVELALKVRALLKLPSWCVSTLSLTC